MEKTLTFAASINGKITKGNDPTVSTWTSEEDAAHFKDVMAKHDVIIRTTQTWKASATEGRKDADKRIIVLTRTPQQHVDQEAPGSLEFTSETPQELCGRLESEGVEKVLISVGGTVAALFFAAGLVDTFLLTIEPKIFGRGIDLVAEDDFDVDLQLIKSRQINEEGTLLLTYKPKNTKSSQ